ncbi:MAG TPA: hypothetical protein VM658_05935 [bacterium]|nr:hypothetical protein [bacterium]
MIQKPGASGTHGQGLRPKPGPFRRGGELLLLLVSWYLLFLIVVFVGGYDPSRIVFIDWIGLSPLIGPYLDNGDESSLYLLGAAAIALCFAAYYLGGAAALAYDRLVKPKLRSDLDFRYINREALGFMISNRRFSVLWYFAILAATLFPFALGVPISGEATGLPTPADMTKLLLIIIIKVAASQFCLALAASFFYSKNIPAETRPADVAARAGVGCLAALLLFGLGMVVMFVFGAVLTLKQNNPNPVYPAWVVLPNSLYALFIMVMAVMMVIRHNEPHRAIIEAVKMFVADLYTLLRFLWSGLGRLCLHVYPFFLIWCWSIFYLPHYVEPWGLSSWRAATPGVLLGGLEKVVAINKWLIEAHGTNLVYPLVLGPISLWFMFALTHTVWTMHYARGQRREQFQTSPTPADSGSISSKPSSPPRTLSPVPHSQSVKGADQGVNWLGAAGVSAGIFLLVGIPIFYAGMLWWDDVTFKRPYGEHHWEFFYAMAALAGQKEPTTVNFYGQPKECATRKQVRDALATLGAGMEDFDGREAGKYRDYFYWDRAAQRFGVIVDYDLTPDGVFFCSGWMRDSNEFRPNVAWLGLAWMLTFFVLGLRLRRYLAARPDADRWLRPWQRRKASPAASVPGSERKWKYSKIVLVPVLVLVWVYCGYTIYGSVQAYRCAVARQQIFKARGQYVNRWRDEPPLEDFIAHYGQYRRREMERCRESMEAVCKKEGGWDESCLAGCTLLPAAIELLSCPSGGKWYLGDQDHVYCTAHPE